jgi:hypothetical protein
MRATPAIAFVLALAAAGCLSKPDRPSGIDAQIEYDARPDAPLGPKFVYRRDAEVGDMDGDGFDDLIRWGDISDGMDPRIWVFRGSATGLSVTPDYEMDTHLSPNAAWYEVLDVSVDDYDTDFAHPELVALVAEDDLPPNGNDPVGRQLHVDVWNPVGNGTTAPIGRSGTIQHDALGGLARAPTPAFVLERDSAVTGAQIVFGGLDVAAQLVDLSSPVFGTPEQVDFQDDTGTSLPFVQDAFDSPGVPDENILAADQGVAWASDGDPSGAFPTYTGLSTVFDEGQRRRAVRAATDSDPLTIAASGEGSPFLQIVQANAGASPSVFALTLLTEEPTDFAIGNVGGTGEIDVVALDGDRLVAYTDLGLGGGTATPTNTILGPSDFVGYNLIAIGNFSDADSGNEIYVLGDDVPARCIVLRTGVLADCQ